MASQRPPQIAPGRVQRGRLGRHVDVEDRVEGVKVLHQDGLDQVWISGHEDGKDTVVPAVCVAVLLKLGNVVVEVGL